MESFNDSGGRSESRDNYRTDDCPEKVDWGSHFADLLKERMPTSVGCPH
jgi:hypothetical protein